MQTGASSRCAQTPVTSASACATRIGTLTGTDNTDASIPPAPPEPIQATLHVTQTDAAAAAARGSA